MFPRKIGFGLPNGVKRFTGPRTIELSPVIRESVCMSIQPGPDKLLAYKIVVSGIAPEGVLDKVTSFSYEVTCVPPEEEPYDIRFYFEHVEWKNAMKGWDWRSADWIWDDFVSERMGGEGVGGEFPRPAEFLGVAREVKRKPSDPGMQDLMPRGKDSFIGGYYRLPPTKS